MGTLLRRAAGDAGVAPVLPGLPGGVEATVRRAEDGTRFLFLLNHNTFGVTVAPPAGAHDLVTDTALASSVELGGRDVLIARLPGGAA